MLAAAMLAACSSHDGFDARRAEALRMIYSPNGEPLNGGPLGKPTCEEAQSHWFERVDTNHDGKISHDEFMADAAAQFLRMDIDKNGYLLSEELERYRLPYRQGTALETQASSSGAENASGQEKPHRRSPHGASGDKDSHHEDSDEGSSPDPVMSAATGNGFKVTLQEFMVQAEKIFTELDANHDGYVNRDELLKTCAKKDKHS